VQLHYTDEGWKNITGLGYYGQKRGNGKGPEGIHPGKKRRGCHIILEKT